MFSFTVLCHVSKFPVQICVSWFLQKVPVLASRAFSSSARQLKNKVPEAQKLFQVTPGWKVRKQNIDLNLCWNFGFCSSGLLQINTATNFCWFFLPKLSNKERGPNSYCSVCQGSDAFLEYVKEPIQNKGGFAYKNNLTSCFLLNLLLLTICQHQEEQTHWKTWRFGHHQNTWDIPQVFVWFGILSDSSITKSNEPQKQLEVRPQKNKHEGTRIQKNSVSVANEAKFTQTLLEKDLRCILSLLNHLLQCTLWSSNFFIKYIPKRKIHFYVPQHMKNNHSLNVFIKSYITHEHSCRQVSCKHTRRFVPKYPSSFSASFHS